MTRDTSVGCWRAWWMWSARWRSRSMPRASALVAFFVLDEVPDGDKRLPQYLVVLTESKDGMPFDFNQVRVFTWNVKRHRYETAYRERNLNGFLPVTVGQENFDKEGSLPVFVLRVKDDDGNVRSASTS